MPVELREVRDRRELMAFINFPFSLYKDNKYWVPPLIRRDLKMFNPDKNPAYEHCEARYVLAYLDGQVAGRIAGIINHEYNRRWNRKTARFCWFDFIDNREVSGALLRDTEQWALSRGLECLYGPMGFTTFEKQGILVEGYNELPTASSVYNFEYYPDHLEALGYVKDHDYIECSMQPPLNVPERIEQINGAISRRYGLKVLHARSHKELMKYAVQVLEVLNAAYEPLVGFVPLSPKQIEYTIKTYSSVLKPDYVTLVLNGNDKVVGFQIAIPSLSRALQKSRGRLFPWGFYHITKAIRRPELLDMMLVGVLPEYQNKGVNALFMAEVIRSCARKKIRVAESNGMLEENQKILGYMSQFTSRQHKRRRLYFKTLS